MHILTSVVGRNISFHCRPISFLFIKSFFNFLNSLPINGALLHYVNRHDRQAMLYTNSMYQLVNKIRPSIYLQLAISGGINWQ